MTQMSGLISSGMPALGPRGRRGRGLDHEVPAAFVTRVSGTRRSVARNKAAQGPVHPSLRPIFTIFTRSRLALTGKPCLPYKPRDFELAAFRPAETDNR